MGFLSGMGNRDLEFVIGVIDQATQPLRDIEQNVSSMGDGVKRTAALMATSVATAGVALAGVAAKATASAVAFESDMGEVFTLLPSATEQAMGQMTDDVLAFSAAAGVVPSDVITPLYNAISAGVPPDNVFTFLETANQAAVGGVTDLNTAVDGLTSVVNAYGTDILSVQEASDAVFTTIRGGKTTFDELSASLFNVIPAAASLGIGIDEVGAALAAMTAQGTPTSVATTQLRQLFVKLADSGSEVGKQFGAVSGQAFPDFVAAGGTVQGALELLEDDADANGVAFRSLFSDVESMNAALLLTGTGSEIFAAQLEEQANAAGATAAAYETMQQTVGRALETLRANVDVVLIQLGQQFLPVLADFSDWVVGNLPTIQKTIQQAFDAIGTAISAGRQAWQDLQTGFEGGNAANLVQAFGVGIAKTLDATRAVIEAFGDTWQSLSDLPAIKASAALAVEIGGVAWELVQEVWAWLDSQPVQSAIQGAVKFGADIAEGAFRLAQDAWAWLDSIAGETIAEARAVFAADIPDMDKLATVGGEMVASILDGIANKLPSLLASGTQMIAQVLEGLATKLPTMIDAATATVANFIDGLGQGAQSSGIIDAARNLVSVVLTSILQASPKMLTAGVNLVAALATSLINGVASVAKAAATVAGAATAEFLGLPGWVTEAWTNAMTDLETVVTTSSATVIGIGKDFVNWILEGLATLGQAMADSGVEAINKFIDDTLGQIQARAAQVTNAITDLFGGGEAEIAQRGSSVTEEYNRALEQGLSGGEARTAAALRLMLQGAFVEGEQVAAFIGNNIGVETVAGMEMGMLGQLQGAIDAGLVVADGVEDAVKSRLGIQSPSRVFAEIGEHTMAGFINSVRDKAADAGTAAREAADAAANAFRDTLTAMSLELDLRLVEPEQLNADLTVISERLREQIVAMQAAGESGSTAYIEVGRQLQAVESQLGNVNRAIQHNADTEAAALERQREQRQRWADWATQLHDEMAATEQARYESAVRMGQVSLDEQLRYIQTRLDDERVSARARITLEEDVFNLQSQIADRLQEQQRVVHDERLNQWRERLQVEAQAAGESQRYQEALYDFGLEQGDISLAQHLDALRERLAATEAGTLDEIALLRQVADTETEINSERLATQEATQERLQAMHAEGENAWRERLQAETAAREQAAAQAQAIARAQYDFDRHTGAVSLQQHLDNLAQRLQGEQLSGEQIIAIQREIYDGEQQLAQEALARQQAIHAERANAWAGQLQAETAAREQAAEQAAEIAANQYAFELEQGDISLQSHLDNLNAQLAGTEQYSSQWVSIMGDIASTQEQMAADEEARIDAIRDANMDMLGTIADGVGSLAPVFEDMGGFASTAFDVVSGGVDNMLTALKTSETGTLSLADGFGAMAGAAASSSDIAISALGGLAQAAMSFATGDIVGGVTGVVTTAISAISGLFSRARRRAEKYRKAVETSTQALTEATEQQWENQRSNQERILELQYSSGLVSTAEYNAARLDLNEAAREQEYRSRRRELGQQFEANAAEAADEQFAQSLRLQYRYDAFNLSQAMQLDEITATSDHLATLQGMETDAGAAKIATYEAMGARVLELSRQAFDARHAGEFELARQLETERDEVSAQLDAFALDLSAGFTGLVTTITVSQEQIDGATQRLTNDFVDSLSKLSGTDATFAETAEFLDSRFESYITTTIYNMAVEAALANSVVAQNMAQLSVLIDEAVRTGDWAAVTAGVADVGAQLQDTLGQLSITVGGALEAVFDETIATSAEGAEATTDALGQSGETMAGAATDAFSSAGDAITAGAHGANDQLNSSTSELELAINASAALIESQMQLAEGTMGASADATYTALMAEIDAGTLTTADALNMSSAELQARIAEQEQNIADEFAASEAHMSGAAEGAFATTEGAVVTGAANITAALDVSQSEIAAGVEASISATNAAWEASGGQLDATINSTLTTAQTSLQTQGQALVGEANALSSSLSAAANTLGAAVAGLGGAITNANATQEAAEAAAAAASAAVDAIEEELDINSPSRVFADIGEMTMLGFGEGIVEAANVPVSAMQSITSALSDAANVNLSRDLDMGIRAQASISATMPSAQMNLLEAEQASREDWLNRQADIAQRMAAAAEKFDTASNTLSSGTVRAAVSNERAANEFAGAARQFDWSRIRK